MKICRRFGMSVSRCAALAFFIAILSLQTPLFAAESGGADNPLVLKIPITMQMSSGPRQTDHIAIVRCYQDETIVPDIWIPSEAVAGLQLPLKLNAGKSAFTLRLDRPGEVLNVPALKTLAPQTLDLEFAARSEDNRQHFNISQIEHVTGVSYVLSRNKRDGAQSTLLIGKTSLMPKKERRPEAKQEWETLDHPFSLVWDHVGAENADLSAEETLPSVKAISPTWFALTDEKGGMSNRGNRSYVRTAHKHGYRVWALVSNGFKKDRTTKFLASAQAQNIFIARLLAYAAIYGFDGINVDFESVANEDAARLTAFVKRLSEAAETMGLSMSIDIMIPSKWSTCYERAALAKLVDYVAVMTYDEHWRTAPKAGSTASLPWVRNALQNTLADIPANKLLLGVPFYTREWEETKNKQGKITVKSKAMSMLSADIRLGESRAEKQWLGTVGQHYYQYVSADKTYKVWMEDASSIALRMELVTKNNLAGAAFWRKGFEHVQIWDEIEKALKRK